jgi:hypothetical protein
MPLLRQFLNGALGYDADEPSGLPAPDDNRGSEAKKTHSYEYRRAPRVKQQCKSCEHDCNADTDEERTLSVELE